MAATAAGSGVPPPDYYAPTAPMSKIGLGGSQQVTFGMQGTQQPGKDTVIVQWDLVSCGAYVIQ